MTCEGTYLFRLSLNIMHYQKNPVFLSLWALFNTLSLTVQFSVANAGHICLVYTQMKKTEVIKRVSLIQPIFIMRRHLNVA